MKKTEELLKTIQSCKKLSGFYFRKQTGTDFRPEIRGSLSGNPDTEKLKKSDVIRNSGIDRGYAYDILSDKKQPSRDKVLLLCLGASFSFEEVQTLLKQTAIPCFTHG